MSNFIEEVDSKNNIIEEYFRLYEKYSSKYGKNNTILFLQIGSFHEAYQTNTQGFELQKISDILNIIVSKKNKSISEVSNKNPYMLGFPSITLNKFIKILIDNGFTIVIGDQVTPPPNPKRAITNIYSPGTYLDDNTPDVNNIFSIYIEEVNNNNLIIGLAVLDLTTGKSIIHEIYSIIDDEKICLDETVRFMYSNQVKEIIITTSNISDKKINDIFSYLEISNKIYHHNKISKSFLKLSYQQELLKKVYPNTGLLTPIEFLDLENLTYGRISFIILLNYAYDHSHNIINNLLKPALYNDSKLLNLGNNAIFQLNLLTFDKDNMTNIYNDKTQFKSLFDVLNKTSTPMGRRMLKQNISQPLVNIADIQNRYNFIEQILDNNIWEEIEKKLIGINDIERFTRKINLGIINPVDLYNWINSMYNSIELFNYIYTNNLTYTNYNFKDILINLNTMLSSISKVFDIEELSKYFINDIHGIIFRPNLFHDIDTLNNNIQRCSKFMDAISWGLSKFLDDFLKVNSKNSNDSQNSNLIKIDYNERDGHFLILTKRRSEVLEQLLNKNNKLNFEYMNIQYELNKDDLQFKHLPKGNNSKIFIKEIEKNSSRMLEYQDQLRNLQKTYFINFLNKFSSEYATFIESVHILVASIDYLKAGAKVANKYHYTIPTISKLNNSNKSYFKSTELRHPIIELLNTDNEYVPTDIQLGTDKQDGILLFGLNSAGKSSLQKSIGIAIIMAQMGYPVAAKTFSFYPYHSLFTRISSNDNIFKGLSSFALEISELRAIIKRSNQNTIVIADEVCKGTEHKSSLIIVLTMLEFLSKSSTSFITATHLHDIINFKRLYLLNNVKLYHLHVEYDEDKNIIIYDRILKEGSGDNFYGLNVAKYLIADNNFMNLANIIKKDIFELPDLLSNKTSNYNTNLYMDRCHVCYMQPKQTEIPLETHHIHFQKDFINGVHSKQHIHKNHKANLVVLCHKCHDKIDNNKIIIKGWLNSNKCDKLEWSYNNNNNNSLSKN